MRPIIQILLLFSLALVSIPLLFVFSVGASGLTSTSIAARLSESSVYETVLTATFEEIEKGTGREDRSSGLDVVLPIAKREITPQYLQGKVEGFLTDTSRWMDGNNAVPVISFEDLKQKVLQNYPGVVPALIQLQREVSSRQMEQARSEGKLTEQEIKEKFGSPPSIEEMLKQKLEIRVGEALPVLKQLGILLRWRWIIAAGYLVCLALLALLADTKSAAMRWVGAAFLAAVIVNIIPFGVLVLSWRVLISLAMESTVPPVAQQLVNSIITPVFYTYARIGGTVLAGAFFGGILCFVIGSFLAGPKPSPAKKIVQKD